MHLKNPLLFGLMAILLLGGTITPVLSQTSPELSIVINEVEFNPRGSDAGLGVGGSGISSKSTEGMSGAQEYVELYNTSSQDIDVSGWSLVPTSTWKKFEIPTNTILESESFLVFTHVNYWFKDFGDQVSLYDSNGNLIDQTPLLKDSDDDATSWQRITDGLDTDSLSDWELKRLTPKSSNGKLSETQTSSFTLSAQTDKSEYTFGDTIIISGNISEQLSSNDFPELIKIYVKGANYFQNLAVFPDRDLNFSTSLNIQKVLGFGDGTYDVEISYGDSKINTQFKIITQTQNSSSNSESESLEVFTDKNSYIPGETVILFGKTNSSIEVGGLEYKVNNPNGKTVFQGTIFPNEKFSTVFQAGSGQIYPFSVQMFMETVNPIYGTYQISGTYKSQDPVSRSTDELTASTSFELVKDEKEDVLISISTDKEYYSIGDTIKITGRSNDIWVEDLELRILQTGLMSSKSVGSDSRYVAPDPFDLRDRVRLNGDGTFSFEFDIVADTTKSENYSKYFGDYKITASEYFGEGITYFKIVENPDTFVELRTPLGLSLDSSEYILGSELQLSGKILNYEFSENDNIRNTVEVTFTNSDGQTISYEDHQQKTGYTNCNSNDCSKYSKPLVYTAIPDLVGAFEINTVLHALQFDYGSYTAKAYHPLSKTTELINFEIKSAQSETVPQTETEDAITMQICKSNRGHTDEILKDLKTLGKGELGASMESVDCSENLNFNVGDKLVVIGKVRPQTGISLDQSSTNPSGQTQTGSSYSTNYAQSIMNYVEVSIPYPTSMIVTKSAAWKTTPNDNENYTGGGGTGGGGVMHGGEDGKGSQAGTGRGEDKNITEKSNRNTGYDGTKVLQKQKLLLTDMRYKAYPDDNGNYATVFELRPGVFNGGTYVVKANYLGYNAEEIVPIYDNSLKGGQKPGLSISIPKSEYTIGETVSITGLIENIYYYDNVNAKIETPDVSKINCFKGQDCGFGNTGKQLKVQESVDGATFFWNYQITKSPSAIGTYKIIVDTHFAQTELEFFVVEETEVIGTPDTSSSTKKIIDKFNRISDNEIPIILGEKSSEESTLMPRVLQGSLFTSARGEESDVNLRVSTSDGQCIIGQDSNCLVSESTRKPGAIYSIVSIDDVNYKIRYSGNDVRLEKFSIVPEESNSPINVDNWKVEVVKDEQPTRFYYKVSYITLE
tara:strand:- start:79 stop:3624 length:3546 start_codon:yes stop_codon:yes gene_type:complete